MPSRRRILLLRYTTVFFALVGGALVVSGISNAYFANRDGRAAIGQLQREQARGAAFRISQFVEQQADEVRNLLAQPGLARSLTTEDRVAILNRGLGEDPSITDLTFIDGLGHEQAFVSRVARDRIGTGADRTSESFWRETKPGGIYFGAVYFRQGSEPYLTVAAREGPDSGGLTVAEVNLKFIFGVVAGTKVGDAGKAYVVDTAGQLVAHPDANLVLRHTDASTLSQVRAATAEDPNGPSVSAVSARSFEGGKVVTSSERAEPPGWLVFVEQPSSEALAALHHSVVRTVALLAGGLVLAVGASIYLAHRAVVPIWTAEGLRRFLSPQVADLIASQRDTTLLQSHRAEIATVFCDLRGFTAFADTTEPTDVMQVLSEYHQCAGTLIRRFQATVGFFAGDGLMVYFNDPLPCADPAGEAIRMADAFREEMKAWCAEWRSRGYNLGLGMGISLGQATIGEIGFEGRHDYGVIGRSVNLAARLCAEAADGEILVDEQAYEGARGIAKMQFIGHLSLKGFQAPAPVYNVLSTAEAAPGGESSADSATE